MKRWVLRSVAVLVVMGLGGLLVAAAGLAPVKASSGHWPITESFIRFAKRRSITTQSSGTTPPRSFQAWQVMKGAGHYETGCRPCHGGPEVRTPGVASAMLPVPPWLPRTVRQRDPAELFFIVRHGLKFTGMPSWPSAGRDDEVWAMVAFLKALPDLDTAAYRRLVHGDVGDRSRATPLEDLTVSTGMPDVIVDNCARCHGLDGEGRGNEAFPRLAGQSQGYLLATLQAFASGERHSGIMEPIAKGLRDEDREAAMRYYSQLPRGGRRSLPDESPKHADLANGEALARRGAPARGVPACVECHGPGPHPRNAVYPELAGQYAGYLALQLELFQRGTRGGTAYAHLMRYVADRLTAAEIRDVTAWYAAQQPAGHR